MLTARQKAVILAKAGVVVPAFPVRRESRVRQQQSDDGRGSLQAREADAEHARAVTQWNHAVDILHNGYAMARAAKSLGEAGPLQPMTLPHRDANSSGCVSR